MENKKPTQFLMKPKVDFCFKELMEDEEVRNAFLAAVLGINLKEINESKILPSHLRQKDKDDKLGILNFIMFDDEEYYCRFHFWSDKGRKLYSDKFEIHTLELPKLTKHDYPETELLKWLQFINAETEEEFEMAAEKSEYIKKAYEDLNRISADEEKRLEYEERERAIRDHQYFSTVYKNTGLKEGRREGRQEGRQEGIQAVVELLQENGTGKRSDMWKSSGKVSHFFTGSSTGSGKILEVGSMGDWEYPHKMFQAFMSNQFADCRDTKCGLT